VVAWFPADLSEQDSALWINHKGTAELPRITLSAGLSESLSKSSNSVSCGPQIDSVRDTTLQTSGPVGFHGGVDKKGKRDLLLLLEGFGMLRTAIADNYKFSAKETDCVHDVAQLRDLLTAEQSAKVPDEDENNRLILPQMTQFYRTALWVKNLYGRQSGSNIHGLSSLIVHWVSTCCQTGFGIWSPTLRHKATTPPSCNGSRSSRRGPRTTGFFLQTAPFRSKGEVDSRITGRLFT
jgi:hypothetical protein